MGRHLDRYNCVSLLELYLDLSKPSTDKMIQRRIGQEPPDVRIVLVGKTGVGKSSTGNTILGKHEFSSAVSSKSVTDVSSKASNMVGGKTIAVVDTPGWCDTELPEAKIIQEIAKCIDMSCPGPHVFLLVLQIGQFTGEEKQTVKKIQDVFGEEASKYMMVLFTRGDDLGSTTIENYLQDAQDDLKTFVFKTCEGRYHVFNNKDKSHHQVSTLIQKINVMVKCNGGSCYTNVTYQLLETYKKKESELQQKVQENQRQVQIQNEELLKRDCLMQQEREDQKKREAELLTLIKQNEIKSTLNMAFLVTLLNSIEIEEKRSEPKEEPPRAATKANRLATEREQELIAHEKRMQMEKQRQQAEFKNHQLHLENEELKRQIEESQHRQRMEEEKQKMEKQRVRMLEKYQARICKLEKERQQIQAEKEEFLRKQVKKKSDCIIS